MDKQQLLDAPEEDYMNDAQLNFFKQLLSELKTKTMLHIEEMKLQLSNPPEINDEVDRAQYEEDSRIGLRIIDRERKLINKINSALKKIDDGTYGYCEETGEPIGLKRLEERPVATLSIEAQEMHEQKERKIN